ncbi:DUF7847 domain-containing protein [Candidatus Pyrohabitans sp.]
MDVVGIYRRAFEIFKMNYLIAVPFIGVNIIVGFLYLLVGGVMMGTEAAPMNMLSMGAALGAVSTIVLLTLILNILAQGMAIGMGLEALNRGTTSLDRGFDVVSNKLGSLIIAALLVGLAVGAGMLLLIIPGLIIGFFLMFTIVALVVEDLDAISAIKRSYQFVRANIANTFVYAVLMVGVGMVAGIVGTILGIIPLIGPVVLSPIVDGLAAGLVTLAGVIFFTEAKKQTT